MNNYKKITINFNLNNLKDRIIYNYLMLKRAKTAYLKDLVEKEMEGK